MIRLQPDLFTCVSILCFLLCMCVQCLYGLCVCWESVGRLAPILSAHVTYESSSWRLSPDHFVRWSPQSLTLVLSVLLNNFSNPIYPWDSNISRPKEENRHSNSSGVFAAATTFLRSQLRLVSTNDWQKCLSQLSLRRLFTRHTHICIAVLEFQWQQGEDGLISTSLTSSNNCLHWSRYLFISSFFSFSGNVSALELHCIVSRSTHDAVYLHCNERPDELSSKKTIPFVKKKSLSHSMDLSGKKTLWRREKEEEMPQQVMDWLYTQTTSRGEDGFD